MKIIKRLQDRLHMGKDAFVMLQSILSYCNNQQNKINGRWENSEFYKYLKTVHQLTVMSDMNELEGCKKRVGKSNDGGYVMYYPFSKQKIAYSFGINDDVSWELDMVEEGYDIYMYDHTIRKLPERNKNFHWFRQGITGDKENNLLKHLETFIRENGHLDMRGMVLKMDVEGAEWNVLKNCSVETLSRFEQIIVEFHGLLNYKNKKDILSALEQLRITHDVVHLHANNYGRVNFCNELITPDTIEVTLINKDEHSLVKSNLMLPIMEDMPCNRRMEDIFLGNW